MVTDPHRVVGPPGRGVPRPESRHRGTPATASLARHFLTRPEWRAACELRRPPRRARRRMQRCALYAHHPVLRARQLAADLGMLAWVVLWVLVARTVHARGPGARRAGPRRRGPRDLRRRQHGLRRRGGRGRARRRRRPRRALRRAGRRERLGDAERGRRRRTPSAPSRPCSPSSSWCCRWAGCCCAGCRGGCATRGRPAPRRGSSLARRTSRCSPRGRWPPRRSPGWPHCPAGTGRGLAGRGPGGRPSPRRPGAAPARPAAARAGRRRLRRDCARSTSERR